MIAVASGSEGCRHTGAVRLPGRLAQVPSVPVLVRLEPNSRVGTALSIGVQASLPGTAVRRLTYLAVLLHAPCRTPCWTDCRDRASGPDSRAGQPGRTPGRTHRAGQLSGST